MRKITTFKPISCPQKIAYLSGIIDALAIFSIKKTVMTSHIAWQCRMNILSTDARIISLLNTSFEVNRTHNTHYDPSDQPEPWQDRRAKKVVKGWSAQGAFLDYVLKIAEPHLQFNLEKVRIVREFRSTFNGLGCHRVDEETQELREQIMLRLRQLNRPKARR